MASQAVDGGAATISAATVTTTNNGSVGLLLWEPDRR